MKQSFFPGRRFANPADVQAQLDDWFHTVANTRVHATLKARPVDMFTAERQAMRPLPPFAPTIGIRPAVRLPRNYYVTVDTNHYSVDAYIDRLVVVRTSLDAITVIGPTGEVAAHHRRCWAQHQTITDPAHQATARAMRHHLTQITPVATDHGVDIADLAIYDQIA